jgi:hypothetical protein
VSSFVDAFVAVGRIFYLPSTLFHLFEWSVDKFTNHERTDLSMEVVDKYVSNLVDSTPKYVYP